MQQTRLKIAEASKLYGIARSTIYRKIKDGELSIDTDKKIDLSEMMRVFGAIPPKIQTKETVEPVAIQDNTTLLLHEKIASLEKALAVAVADKEKLEADKEKVEADKEWLKSQVEQSQQIIKLLEYKNNQNVTTPSPPPKKSLFGRIVKAITD